MDVGAKIMDVELCDDRARLPEKAGPHEIGYDLLCIKKIARDAEWDKNYLTYGCVGLPGEAYPIPFQNQFPLLIPGTEIPVAVYDTGIKVKPPPGYYCEILPRSSMSKLGVMLLNSVGVIDPTYRGTLKVCLAGCVPKTPFKLCQLVLRRVEPNFEVKKVDSVGQTVRGAGGFGSTDGVQIHE